MLTQTFRDERLDYAGLKVRVDEFARAFLAVGIRRGDRVALLVNRGERASTYVMPDLIGVDGDRASDFLRGRGFRVAVTGTQPYPGVPAGIVIRQTPAGGFQVAPGDAIALEVSR